MKKKGFTLIELLAVIVILAIIALIATPLVLKYIEKARSESTIRSAENYIDAVEHAITAENFKGGRFNPSVCEIKNDGNLLCDDRTIKVEVKGEVPSSGTITIENEKIKDVELVYQDKTIVKEDGKLVYLVPLSAGLYDEEGNLIATWDELVKSGIILDKDYIDENFEPLVEESKLTYVILSNDEKLKQGTKLVIDSSIKKIGKGALGGCTSLKEVIIPNSVTSIGEQAFAGCTSLEKIIVPNSVTSIGDSAFDGCTNLKEITISNSVTSIGTMAFRNCTSLKEIIIPNSVTSSIGYASFENCTSLEKVTIGNGVTSIEKHAFYYCTSLKEITIPSSVTSTGYESFYNCKSLKTINYTGTGSDWMHIAWGQDSYKNTPADKTINYNYVIPQN